MPSTLVPTVLALVGEEESEPEPARVGERCAWARAQASVGERSLGGDTAYGAEVEQRLPPVPGRAMGMPPMVQQEPGAGAGACA